MNWAAAVRTWHACFGTLGCETWSAGNTWLLYVTMAMDEDENDDNMMIMMII